MFSRQGVVHRGAIGVEAAIVLISVVIVAASLAFVVLNAGFDVTQKSKTAVMSSIGEAGSSLTISGKIIGSGHQANNALNVTGIPIKISSGGGSVNLAEAFTVVRYAKGNVAYDDIYAGTLSVGMEESLEDAVGSAGPLGLNYFDADPYMQTGWPTQTAAFIYWIKNNNNDDVLDASEHAVLAIVFSQNDRPRTDDKIKIELISSDGATLSIERIIPTIANQVVDLG